MIISKNFAFALLEGNLTSDPELKKVGNGKVVSTFSIAVNHFSKDDSSSDSDVSFIDVETWDKLAENCAEYLKKGRSVTIFGNLKQDRWKASDGTNRNRMKVIASNVRFNQMEKNYQKEKPTEERKAA
jgi:single-strand DNA-binding protein